MTTSHPQASKNQEWGVWSSYLKAVPTALRSILLGANLESLSLVAHPKQWLYYCNGSRFMLHTLAGRRRLPQKQVWEVLPQARGDLQICLPRVEAGWFSADPSFVADMVSLALLCHVARPRRVFEIGTYLGYTALLFAANAGGAQVFTLDLGADAEAGNSTTCHLRPTALDYQLIRDSRLQPMCFQGHPEEKRIVRLFGDSATFDFAPYAGSVDFFFIDGAHSYEYVRSDTLKALTCCHPGSVVAWHDYGRSGLSRDVSRWLDEMAREREICSVPGSSVAYMICT